LVLADSLSWNLQVGAGPLVGKTEVLVKPFALAELPDQKPYDFQFADWDGDGLFDVLFVSGYRKPELSRWLYDVYWCRNTARDGEPRFEEPVRLLTAPAQSARWEYADYAIVDRGPAGCQDLVVSVCKDWKRDPKRGGTNNSQLVLYPRRVDPSVPPHPARK
jgi:hypothetical protein